MIKLGRGVAVNIVISIFWREQDAPAVFCCQMHVSWGNDIMINGYDNSSKDVSAK